MTDTTPIERLRDSHAMRADGDGDSFCGDCGESWPCDVIAALDALEEQHRELQEHHAAELAAHIEALDWRDKEIIHGRRRIDAATVLLRRGVFDTPDLHRVLAWLAGDKEATDA